MIVGERGHVREGMAFFLLWSSMLKILRLWVNCFVLCFLEKKCTLNLNDAFLWGFHNEIND